MKREARTLFLGILTWIAFAVSMFISDGAFIFPFPLNEFIFLAVSVQFFWWNRREKTWPGILAITAGICAVLSKQFFWTFIYEQEEMTRFMEGLTTDYFLLAFYGLLLVGGVLTSVQQKKGLPLLLSTLFLLFFVAGIFLNNLPLILLGFSFMVASTQLKKTFAPFHLLWILLFLLKLSEWLTLILNS